MYVLKHPQDVQHGYLPEVTNNGYWLLPGHVRAKYEEAKPTGTAKPGQQAAGRKMAAESAAKVGPT